MNDRRNSVIGGQYLRCAQLDIESCTILYNFGLYSSSVYHLQQAAEKTAKAFLLLGGGDVTPEDLKTHDFSTWLKRDFQRRKRKSIGRNAPSEGFDALSKLMRESEQSLGRTSHEEIIEAFDLFKKGAFKGIKAMSKETMNEKEVKGLSAIYAALTTFLLFTQPHEQSTRYPDRELKPWEYDENLGIVKGLPDLLDVVKSFISSLNQFVGKQIIEG